MNKDQYNKIKSAWNAFVDALPTDTKYCAHGERPVLNIVTALTENARYIMEDLEFAQKVRAAMTEKRRRLATVVSLSSHRFEGFNAPLEQAIEALEEALDRLHEVLECADKEAGDGEN